MQNRMRYEKLDSIRGMALLHMVAYHTVWDLVYLYQFDWHWYKEKGAYIWQQGICWTFIFLSGFCWSLGSRTCKRGMIVFLGGVIITLVTVVVMPSNRIVFGVLTLIGSCMLLMQIFDPWLRRLPAALGVILSFLLFFLTRNINEGWLGFEQWNIIQLPTALYCNLFMTYLGFTQKAFYSTDYFSLFPWAFLFLAGYFSHHFVCRTRGMRFLEKSTLRPVAWIGRHSFEIYMVHQPVIYAVLELVHQFGMF